ncbi:hypothetical protein VP395_10295 [Mariniflexile soesokkakense]|uniref:7-cyano-7-deazaguanine synthase n=1 Tax=Mariniflexile soesokkakense TaxID=1343160 RepID=A0ABV0AF49_9FLAO
MFKLDTIIFEDEGHKIAYNYTVNQSIKKYFNINNKLYVIYDKDVSNIPMSITVIPLLANIMPISWFAGFDVFVEEIDETFYNSLKELKIQFEKHHPKIKSKGKLRFKKLVNNTFGSNNSMLLFSGGLDSFESLTRNYDKHPYLVSIHGADVKINDNTRWNQFKKFNEVENIIDNKKLKYLESNLRDFYTYKVDLLINSLGWWGEIQHGMALLGVLAPLTNVLGVKQVFIASSNTKEVDFSWGSRPEIDENMKWANVKIIHDGYHLRRPEKIVNVVGFVKKHNEKINLRVCYSDLRNGANCNICPKCQRTMLGLILANENPANYGLQIPDNFYQLLLSNFENNTVMSKGLEYEWWCLQEKVKENKPFFVINNEEQETFYLKEFKELNLKEIINKNSDKISNTDRIKFVLRNKFSKLYNSYLKTRY